MLSLHRLFHTKPVEALRQDSEGAEQQLRRALGPVDLTLLGIGAIIGAGIFATIGTAAAGDSLRPGAGPALMVSFVLTAIVCGFTALCYAEFAAMVPVSGSAYTYAYASLGELVAWIIGWDLIIEYAVGNIAVAISWANYFKTFLKGFGILVPDWLSMDYRSAAKVPGVLESAPQVFGVPIVFNLLAVGIVTAITVVLIVGIRESARFNAVMVGIKILVLTFFIIVGFLWVQPANWQPFAPNGWSGVSAGAAIVFFAYIGFDAVSTVAEETKDPQRNLPIGIIASLIICTVFYVVVAAAFTGLISYDDLRAKLNTEVAEPLTMALEHANPKATWASGIVAFGSVVAHTAVLLVFQLGQPRIFFAMARDGLLPPAFARVHRRFRTPYLATILTGIFVAVFAAFASIDEMVDLTNIGTLFAFILVCAGIIVLRRRDPDRPRPFRVPGGIVLPILGIAGCLYLVYYLPPTSWLRFAAWLNLGFVIYVGYGIAHSHLTGRHRSDRPFAHDGYSARAGVGLAFLGVALLMVMHVLTLGLGGREDALKAASEAGRNITFADEWRAGIAAIQQGSNWLALPGLVRNELFWFVVLPLALNAFVLCPIVMVRARRAAREGEIPTALMRQTMLAVVTLTVAVTVYFACLAWYNWTIAVG
ncbi:MAG: amino acid permease [Gemmataceae bacterium]|nr:amino acid permease [Gemmataceae bacterium]